MPRLSPRPALAILSALALVAALSAACTGCGGGGSTTIIQTTTVTDSSTTNEGPTTTETTTDSTSTDTTGTNDTNGGGAPGIDDTNAKHLQTFQSPSGNIGCVFSAGGVRCDIADRDWKPGPAPANCRLDYGQGIELGRSNGAKFVCAGDTTLGAGPKLAYGDVSEIGGSRCSSAEDGVTCENASGFGFFISKQSYDFKVFD